MHESPSQGCATVGVSGVPRRSTRDDCSTRGVKEASPRGTALDLRPASGTCPLCSTEDPSPSDLALAPVGSCQRNLQPAPLIGTPKTKPGGPLPLLSERGRTIVYRSIVPPPRQISATSGAARDVRFTSKAPAFCQAPPKQANTRARARASRRRCRVKSRHGTTHHLILSFVPPDATNFVVVFLSRQRFLRARFLRRTTRSLASEATRDSGENSWTAVVAIRAITALHSEIDKLIKFTECGNCISILPSKHLHS